jgi:ribosomal protein S12 methylthiotransferase
MRRPAHQENTLDRLRAWREICPDLAIRSTFIVGFPGETEEDFAELLAWLSEAKLARVGCFKYEDVAGAAANALSRQVPAEVKAERHDRLMRHQQAISAELLASRVGKTIEVMVDRIDDDGVVARSHWDAPEIDGSVYLDGGPGLAPGDRLEVLVEDADEYDLYARPAGTKSKKPKPLRAAKAPLARPH